MYRWQDNTGYAKLIFNKDLQDNFDKNLAKICYSGGTISFERKFENKRIETDIFSTYHPIDIQVNSIFKNHLQQHASDIFVDYYKKDSNTLIVTTYKADNVKSEEKILFCTNKNIDFNKDDFYKTFCFITNFGKRCIYISVSNNNFILCGKDKYAKITLSGNLIIINSISDKFDEKKNIVYQVNIESIEQIGYKDREKHSQSDNIIPVSDIFREWSCFTNYMKQAFDKQKEQIGLFPYTKEGNSIFFDISRKIYEENEEFLDSVQLNAVISSKRKGKRFLFKDCEIDRENADKITFKYYIKVPSDWSNTPETGDLEISNSNEQKRREEILNKLHDSDILMKASNGELREPDIIQEEIHKGLTEKVVKKVYKKSKPEEVDNYKTIDEIIIGAINSPDICLIQGPAGTGKTTIINAIITRLYEKNKDTKFLICAEQHDAVKNIMDRISKNNISYVFSTRNTEKISKNKNQQDILDKCRLALDKYEQTLDESDNRIYNDLQSAIISDNYKVIVSETEKILNQTTDKNIKDVLYAIKEYAEIIQRNDIDDTTISCSIYLSGYCDDFKEDSDIKQYLKDKTSKLCASLTSNDEPDNMYKIIYDFTCAMQSDNIFSWSISKYADTIGGTCAQAYKVEKTDEKDKYDYVIIDEAARANPVDVLMPLFYGKHIIMVGDHKQLPHYINSQRYQEYIAENSSDNASLLKQSLFGLLYEKLIKLYNEGKITNKRTFMLNTQYRMPETIGTFISRCFYNKELFNGTQKENCKNTFNVFNGKNLVFYDIPTVINNRKYSQKNYVRDIEVEKTIDIVKQILAKNDKPLDIGIISFYKNQSDAIKDRLNELQQGYTSRIFTNDISDMCGTVDSFQGKEFDIVILSCVCSDNRLGFLDSEEGKSRINVSLTRARKLLIVIGDRQTLTGNECFLELEDHIERDDTASCFIKQGDTEWDIK